MSDGVKAAVVMMLLTATLIVTQMASLLTVIQVVNNNNLFVCAPTQGIILCGLKKKEEVNRVLGN